jgi:DNA-binding response OmpR family regulator
MPKTILIADNHTELLEVRSEYLQNAGFRVLCADSPAAARNLLAAEWVHLAILDIRLSNDQDPYDISGLQIAVDPAFGGIPKIMLTNYPDFEYVRKAMLPAVAGLPPAVDFLTKSEGPEAMVAAVHSALAKYSQTNWELQILVGPRWQSPAPNLHSLLLPADDEKLALSYRDETMDLLRRLFLHDGQVTLDRLLWRRPHRLAFTVHAYTVDGQEHQYLITYGSRDAIAKEQKLAGEITELGVNPGLLRFIRSADTLHFGANCYEPHGQPLDAMQSLPEYWRANTNRDCASVVVHICENCYAPWHNPRHLISSDSSFHELYSNRLDLPANLAAQVTARFERLGAKAAHTGLAAARIVDGALLISTPRGRELSFPALLEPLAPALKRYAYGAVCSLTLGEINLDTILVDANRVAWLTDFNDIRTGPTLGDYAALETALKLDLVEDALSLDDLYELEHELLQVARLSQRVDPNLPAAGKLLAAVAKLRLEAADELGDAAGPYLIALYYQSLKRFLAFELDGRSTRRELSAQLHVCISIGLLGSYLSRAVSPPGPVVNALRGLTIDAANREVRVDGRLIDLSPSQYAALLYLWQHAGLLCTREDIRLAVYGQDSILEDRDAMTMLLSRLRAKIESDPANPKYLVTRRGSGIVLHPNP